MNVTFKMTTVMKKIAILLLSVTVAFSSCDILNNDPYDSFTKSNYFTSVENVELFANYFYSAFSGYSGDFYFNILNDDQAKTGVELWTFMQQPASASAWNSPYSNIRRCNLLIEAIPGIESMTTTQKNHWLGVSRLMRAWYHYKVVRGFGDCYWVNHVLDPKADADILYGPRTDRDIVMDSILADLNFAVENMTLYSTSRTQLNQYVANAMKAEVCLYEGTFCRYRVEADGQKAPNEARAQQYLRECCNACEVILGSGKYSLTPKYTDVYTSLNLEGNPEMILYKHYAYPTLGHSVIDYTCGSTQVNGMTKDAFNSYLSDEGELMPYGDDHGTLVNGKPNVGAQIARRDPRLACHVDAALQFPGNGVARYADDPTTEAGKNASESTSSTGYGVLKFDTKQIDRVRRQSIGQGDTDSPIFWTAVIMLDYAEAKAELGEFDATVQGATLDKLRARAGNVWGFDGTISDPRKNMNVSDLLYEIRRERRVELMYDINDRYYSLQRWHCLYLLDTQQYPDQKKGAWIGTANDADKLFDVDAAIAAGTNHPDVDADGYIDCSSGNNRIYNAKYYLFPIPSDQQTLNPQIGQNYGW